MLKYLLVIIFMRCLLFYINGLSKIPQFSSTIQNLKNFLTTKIGGMYLECSTNVLTSYIARWISWDRMVAHDIKYIFQSINLSQVTNKKQKINKNCNVKFAT